MLSQGSSCSLWNSFQCGNRGQRIHSKDRGWVRSLQLPCPSLQGIWWSCSLHDLPQHLIWLLCSSPQSQGWTHSQSNKPQLPTWHDPEINICSWDSGVICHSAKLSNTVWVLHLLTGKSDDYDIEPNIKRYFLGGLLGLAGLLRKLLPKLGS